MDYRNLIADKQYFISNSHTAGREGHDIDFFVLHHNAGVRQSTEEVGNFWEGSGTSAHYQVEADGTVGQLVHDRDTAYHAGDWNTNLRSQTFLGTSRTQRSSTAESSLVLSATDMTLVSLNGASMCSPTRDSPRQHVRSSSAIATSTPTWPGPSRCTTISPEMRSIRLLLRHPRPFRP